MPSAPGQISGSDNHFRGEWIVDDNLIFLHGDFDQFPGGWIAESTLEYDNIEDLAGNHYTIPGFHGQSPSHVGPVDLSLSLTDDNDKRIKITGFLKNPISEKTEVSGHGGLVRQG
ncbi:hypothetical protein DTO271G3_2280 [Paecilomyces variotii]|nr:hypothetical protein DTO271G3_2280 [Paecilomyces variotii]